MPLMKIRLELGRTPDHPQGDPRHGYEFVAPLDGQGYLDPVEWKAQKDRCAVHRFHPHQAEYRGRFATMAEAGSSTICLAATAMTNRYPGSTVTRSRKIFI